MADLLSAAQIVTLFKSYFGGEFSEQSIKNNFVLIYELMDEILDFGFPQACQKFLVLFWLQSLALFICSLPAGGGPLHPEAVHLPKGLHHRRRQAAARGGGTECDASGPACTSIHLHSAGHNRTQHVYEALQVTGAVGWRKDNIRYKKNEVYLDIVEKVNLLMSSKGAVLRADVNGKIVMKVFLSGMPDVKLGLNDKLEVIPAPICRLQSTGNLAHETYIVQDVTFHQCVNLGRFNTEKVVSFVPPDGEFELMKYRRAPAICTRACASPEIS